MRTDTSRSRTGAVRRLTDEIVVALGAERARRQWSDADAFATLYDALRAMTGAALRQESSADARLTDVAHLAFLRLIEDRHAWEGRAPFLAATKLALRRSLVTLARERLAQKRGGGTRTRPLSAAADVADPSTPFLALDAPLRTLAATHPRLARVAELHAIGELTIAEVAKELGCTTRQASSDWTLAKAMLAKLVALTRREPAAPPQREPRRAATDGVGSAATSGSADRLLGSPA